MSDVTFIKYIAIPPEKFEHLGPAEFSVNGYSAAMKLAQMGWSVYCVTTEWKKMELKEGQHYD